MTSPYWLNVIHLDKFSIYLPICFCCISASSETPTANKTLRVFEGNNLTLSWKCDIKEQDILSCFYQTTNNIPFLGYNYNLTMVQNLTTDDFVAGWTFVDLNSPCITGIKHDAVQLQHTGTYTQVLIDKKGNAKVSSAKQVFVYKSK